VPGPELGAQRPSRDAEALAASRADDPSTAERPTTPRDGLERQRRGGATCSIAKGWSVRLRGSASVGVIELKRPPGDTCDFGMATAARGAGALPCARLDRDQRKRRIRRKTSELYAVDTRMVEHGVRAANALPESEVAALLHR
jgi:hypothetical protein